jgi:hypothetical protein
VKIITQLMDVEAMWIRETTNAPPLKDEKSKIQIRTLTLSDMPSLKANGTEPIPNIIDLDVDSAIRFEMLYIKRVGWVDNTMCVYFTVPTDIAIVDEEEPIDVPFDPSEPPLRSILVTELNNIQPPLLKNN